MLNKDYVDRKEKLRGLSDMRQSDMGSNLFALVGIVAWLVYLILGG